MTRRTLVVSTVLLAIMVSAGHSAERSQRNRREGQSLWGDWNVKMQMEGGGNPGNSILSFSRDREGGWKGKTISFTTGMRDLQDVTFEDGNLAYSQTMTYGDNRTATWKFAGKVVDGKLTGNLSTDHGDIICAGTRAVRISRAVGEWEVKYKIGERDITSGLVIKADKEGKLSADWKSEQGEHVISDLKYERGALSFKRKSTFGERVIESTFEGRISRGELTGKIKSEMGEVDAVGTLKGRELVGTWNLDLPAGQRKRRQRLLVNSDLSGLYGSLPIKKIEFQDGKVTFNTAIKANQFEYKLGFSGKIEDSKLVGELETSVNERARTRKVTGTKVVRTYGRSRGDSSGANR